MSWKRLKKKRGKQHLPGLWLTGWQRTFSLSLDLVEALNCKYVFFLFDGEKGRLALEPSPEKLPTAYKIAKNVRQNTYHISSRGIMIQCDLHFMIGHTYQVVKEDGLFVIDLNQDS